MSDHRTFEIPRQATLRPRDPRNRPVPYLSRYYSLGEVNTVAQRNMINNNLCQVCGLPFDDPAELVFGVIEMLEQYWNVLDSNGLMHIECLDLALQWCPAFRRYDHRIVYGPPSHFRNGQWLPPYPSHPSWSKK